MENLPLFGSQVAIDEHFDPESNLVLYPGNVGDFLATLPDETATLIITSPPYNLGKEYENRVAIEEYLEAECWVFVEWPDRIPSLLPDDRTEISLTTHGPDLRNLQLQNLSL